MPIADLAALHKPLAPGEARALDLPLPDQNLATPLVLTIGAERFEIGR